MKFKRLEIEDRGLINKFLVNSDRIACEYCFCDIFMWKDKYNPEFYLEDEWLYIRQFNKKENRYYYYLPMTLKKDNLLNDAINKIIIDAVENKYTFSIGNIKPEIFNMFENDYKGMFEIENLRDCSDYIYNSDDLINLSGKKFHKKKNLINKFKREYENRWEYKNISVKDKEDILIFNKKWCDNNLSKDVNDMNDETIAIKNALNNFETLNMCGGMLLIDGDIIAYTLGCESTKDVFVVQIEKALGEYVGAYQMINNLFAINNAGKYKYINREEDLGIEGLRKAKMSYNPVFIEEYYLASINNIHLKKKCVLINKKEGINVYDKIC